MKKEPVSENQASLAAGEEWDEEELEAASQGIRLVNYLFDVMALLLLAAGVGTALGALGLEAWMLEGNNNLLVAFLITVAYYLILESLTSRTLGKFITGTYVVTHEGLKPGFATILGRTLCRLIPLEILSFLFSSIGQHDWL